MFIPHAGDDPASLVDPWTPTYPVRRDALTAEINPGHLELVMTSADQGLSLRRLVNGTGDVRAAPSVVGRHLGGFGSQPAELPRSTGWHGTATPWSSGIRS